MSERKQVIVFPRGSLDEKTSKKLSRAGYLAIEADDPSKVVCVLPIAPSASLLKADDLTLAALQSVRESPGGEANFGRALAARILASEVSP